MHEIGTYTTTLPAINGVELGWVGGENCGTETQAF